MSRPKAYDPRPDCKYQIFCRSGTREWEHCDYAADKRERDYLAGEYRMAYGPGWEFKSVTLPAKYWPKRK